MSVLIDLPADDLSPATYIHWLEPALQLPNQHVPVCVPDVYVEAFRIASEGQRVLCAYALCKLHINSELGQLSESSYGLPLVSKV